MPLDEIESLISSYVPGRGPLEIHRSSYGLVNETYRVLRDAKAYAVRVAVANSHDLGLDRAWEARVLERAVAADLAPELTYCDPQRGILITHWVDGRLWSPADVRRQSNIARMAELLRRLHALPMPAPARVMAPAAWIDHYSAAALQNVLENPSARALGGAAVRRSTEALRIAATARLAAFAALPGVAPVVCHSDLHTFNLVDRGRSLLLLDWEYAHGADPLWDLAGWSANNDLEDDLKRALLASYAGRAPTSDDYLRLELLGWLYDYICLLWSELYVDLGRDDSQGSIAGRVRVLAARLGARL
jgi:thiamine kinase